MGDWIFQPFVPGLEAQLNREFNRAFCVSRALEEWHWKFTHCPWGIALLIAKSRNEAILAHYATIPTPFKVALSTHLIGQGVDAFRTELGLTDYRYKHVYRATVNAFFNRYCENGAIELIYGFAGSRHARVLITHLGHKPVGTVPAFELRRGRFWGSSVSRNLMLGFNLELWLDLWRRVADRYRVVACRDEAFVRWRYLLHPARPYWFLFSWDGEKPYAAAVLRARGETCYLVDVLWDGQSPGALADLLNAAARIAWEWGCSILYTWLHGDPELVQILLSCGWVPSKLYSDITVTAISARTYLDPQSFWDNAFITMADGDLV